MTLFAIPALCGAIGFGIGHYTAEREPFYLLGTPIELSASDLPPATGDSANKSSLGSERLRKVDQGTISQTAEKICGARTKSGKPCQRKVKGGGYCWQHRDKQAAKEK